MKVLPPLLPPFEVSGVKTTHLEGFICAGYFLYPELVQFHVTSHNLNKYRVHLTKQGLVLLKWSRKY